MLNWKLQLVTLGTTSITFLTWSERILRSLCFLMPLYSGLVKILSLLFFLPDQWHTLCSLSSLASVRSRFLATGDVCTSWLAVRALHSDSPRQQQSVCKRHRQSAQALAETNQFNQLQLSLQLFRCWLKLDLKERATKKGMYLAFG